MLLWPCKTQDLEQNVHLLYLCLVLRLHGSTDSYSEMHQPPISYHGEVLQSLSILGQSSCLQTHAILQHPGKRSWVD